MRKKARVCVREREREASFENTWIHVFLFRTSLNILSIINPIVANNGHYEERKPRGYVTYSLCIYNPPPKKTLYTYIVTHIIHYTLVVHRYILYVKLKLINETDLVDVYRIEDGLCKPVKISVLPRMCDKSE